MLKYLLNQRKYKTASTGPIISIENKDLNFWPPICLFFDLFHSVQIETLSALNTFTFCSCDNKLINYNASPNEISSSTIW